MSICLSDLVIQCFDMCLQGTNDNSSGLDDELILRGQPWHLDFSAPSGQCTLVLSFTFHCAADIELRQQQAQLSVDFGADRSANFPARRLLHAELQFVTQVLDYNHDLQSVVKQEDLSEHGTSNGSRTCRASKRVKR